MEQVANNGSVFLPYLHSKIEGLSSKMQEYDDKNALIKSILKSAILAGATEAPTKEVSLLDMALEDVRNGEVTTINSNEKKSRSKLVQDKPCICKKLCTSFKRSVCWYFGMSYKTRLTAYVARR